LANAARPELIFRGGLICSDGKEQIRTFRIFERLTRHPSACADKSGPPGSNMANTASTMWALVQSCMIDPALSPLGLPSAFDRQGLVTTQLAALLYDMTSLT
jgi:hypothetical protein